MSWTENKVKLGRVSLKPLFWWIASRVTPRNPAYDLDLPRDTPVLYVIANKSFIDAMVLYKACEEHGLPLPDLSVDRLFSTTRTPHRGAFLALSKPKIVHGQRLFYQEPKLAALLQELKRNRKRDIRIVPVSIFWGRNPGKGEQGLFKLLFSDDANAGMLQKLFIVLAHGRNNIIKFGQAISLQEVLRKSGSPAAGKEENRRQAERYAIIIQRMCRVYFQRERNMVLGEKLYDRDQIVRKVAKSAPVRDLIRETTKSAAGAMKQEIAARKYAREIAADMTYSIVLAFSMVLSKLWNKLYDGVEVRGLLPVKDLANKKYEIVYVSNHRSHLDYLLANYSLYANDLPTPHTAAGINLNFFPIGVILRKGGAFFIRRTFRGNRLYTMVFNEYLHYLLTNGYPVQFFPEGGRSRTGWLRQPKSGFFSMITHSALRDYTRPIALVPVHVNYDKVAEVGSYLKELKGDKKRKENFFQLFQSLNILKKYWGKAYLNFGEPLILGDMLDEMHPSWRNEVMAMDRRPEWFNGFVEHLSHHMMTRINSAAVVTPIALISFVLLSSPHKAMPEDELIELCEGLRSLLARFVSIGRLVLPAGAIADHLKTAEKLGTFGRLYHSGGDIIHVGEVDAILVRYYRNNISHLMALPALVARFFHYNARIPSHKLKEALVDIYPLLQADFFLPWPQESIAGVTDRLLEVMLEMGLLQMSGGPDGDYFLAESSSFGHVFMTHLGQDVGINFDSLAITTILLAQPDQENRTDFVTFVQRIQKIAQRLTILNGVALPVTAEGDLFSSHLDLLERLGFLTTDKGFIEINERLATLATHFKMILKPENARHFLARTGSLQDHESGQPVAGASSLVRHPQMATPGTMVRQGAVKANTRPQSGSKRDRIVELKSEILAKRRLSSDKITRISPDDHNPRPRSS